MRIPLIVHEKIFIVLILVTLILGSLNIAQASGFLIPQQPAPTIIDNIVLLDTFTLEQKIAQMTVIIGDRGLVEMAKRSYIGGAHLFAHKTLDELQETISFYQEGLSIPLFITADFEGCLNPFETFKQSLSVSEVTTVGEAFQKGSDDGAFLQDNGFTINFAPVVDLRDDIWNCRSFPGDDPQKIGRLAEAYVLGLQSQGIIATAKHYPGKTLEVRDPHKFLVSAEIDDADIAPYTYFEEKDNLGALMVSHIITTGTVDSHGVPSVVSPEVIGELKKNYSGLIVSDEINMLGLRNFYGSLDEMYIAVFKAGNDIVLNFNLDPNEIYHMITVVADAVRRGVISEKQIDASVEKILRAKGFEVKQGFVEPLFEPIQK
ncbi:MAG: glycoside hydrolase family 3 N-terminal domain-containing protein [archaeon]|nr:glycoside hydrolase family 3 N-terminal domain-containing protein [archaeon]